MSAPVEPVGSSVSVNQLTLTAQIESAKALRYTPAGLPALDMELLHESDLLEAGQKRQIKLVVKAVALGSLAESLVKQAVGSQWRFSGFLAAARSKPQPSKTLVFHIQSFQQADTVQPVSESSTPAPVAQTLPSTE